MTATENHLIELLPRNDRRRLLDVCEPIHLILAEVIHEPGAATLHVYFPVDGFISLVAQIDEHSGLEVGMVGREGMLGVRRVGITEAAGSLQRSGLIAYNRGTLNVLDRPGLEATACACDAADRKSYAGLL